MFIFLGNRFNSVGSCAVNFEESIKIYFFINNQLKGIIMKKKVKIAKRKVKFLLDPFRTYRNNINFKRSVDYTVNF